jgi:hypothetical protein
MTVSTLVILGLAVVWAVVLLPEAVKKWRSTRSVDSVASFSRSLSHLERANPRVQRGESLRSGNVIDLRQRRAGTTQPRPVATPVRVSPEVRRRRQEVLTGLVAAALLTLVCTIAFGGVFLVPHLLADALLVAYVVCLHQVTNRPAAAVRPPVDATRSASPRTGHPASHHDSTLGRVSPVRARSIAN